MSSFESLSPVARCVAIEAVRIHLLLSVEQSRPDYWDDPEKMSGVCVMLGSIASECLHDLGGLAGEW